MTRPRGDLRLAALASVLVVTWSASAVPLAVAWQVREGTTLASIVDRSSAVVIGQVVSQRTEVVTEGQRSREETYSEIVVGETLRGVAGASIVVRQIGGPAGLVEGDARLRVGARVLLILGESRGSYQHLMLLGASAYDIVATERGELARPHHREPQARGAILGAELPLADLVRFVRSRPR
jgi:hypothetical protein